MLDLTLVPQEKQVFLRTAKGRASSKTYGAHFFSGHK
jgi:hypothetical protein